MVQIFSARLGRDRCSGVGLVARYLLLSYLLFLGLALLAFVLPETGRNDMTLRDILFLPLFFTPFCLPFVATVGFLLRVAVRDRIRSGWWHWARRFGQLMLLCWACALSLDLFKLYGALADNLPPAVLCVDLRYSEPAPAGVLDLRLLDLPCGFKPLTGTAILLLSSLGLLLLVLPAALVLGLAFGAIACLIRWAISPQ